MVEYAILVGGAALRSVAADVSDLFGDVNWTYVGYAVLMLAALKLASWAFRPTR